MPITWYRDLVVIVSGLVAVGVLIYIAVLLNRLSRKLGPILDSVESTTKVLEQMSAQVVNPMVQIMAIIQLITRGMGVISNMFKKEGGEHGKQ